MVKSLLTTLTSLFPGASGIKYRNSDSGAMRGLRLIDGRIQPPEDGWTQVPLYYCCFPKGIYNFFFRKFAIKIFFFEN